jgi:hypothetical protein
MRGSAATPAANHLFEVNQVDPVPLGKEKADIYMHIVMQLLYLSQRARPDLRTAVSFLCGRLTKPDEDDYKKLARVMKYLDSTADMPLVLAADDTGKIRWWVDASASLICGLRGYEESYWGGTMSLGKLIWTAHHFLDGQGIHVDESILYQDHNTSAILIEKNERSSCMKRTRHMNIRYFFLKDQVDSKRVKIEHCPTTTGDMLADYFTKPLQGPQFRKLRDRIMNIAPSSAYHSSNSGHRSVLEMKSPSLPSFSDVSMSATSTKSYKEVLLGSKTCTDDEEVDSLSVFY